MHAYMLCVPVSLLGVGLVRVWRGVDVSTHGCNAWTACACAWLKVRILQGARAVVWWWCLASLFVHGVRHVNLCTHMSSVICSRSICWRVLPCAVALMTVGGARPTGAIVLTRELLLHACWAASTLLLLLCAGSCSAKVHHLSHLSVLTVVALCYGARSICKLSVQHAMQCTTRVHALRACPGRARACS